MTFKLFGTVERTYWKTIFESSSGGTGASNWVDLGQVENVRYKILAVGGGGGGSNSWNDSTPSDSACAGGGSGGYAYVLFDNTSGQSSGGNISAFVGQGGASAFTTGYYNNITASSGVSSTVRFPKSSGFTAYAYSYNGETYYTDTTYYPESAYSLDSSGIVTESDIIIVNSGDNSYICFSKSGTPQYTRDTAKDTTAKEITTANIVIGGGGTGGATGMDRYGTAGTGGNASVDDAVFTFVENSTITGKSGTAFGSSYGTATGGESLYLGHGKGGSAGPGDAVESGSSGYIRIDKQSDSSDYTYIEEKISEIQLANDFGVMKGYNE